MVNHALRLAGTLLFAASLGCGTPSGSGSGADSDIAATSDAATSDTPGGAPDTQGGGTDVPAGDVAEPGDSSGPNDTTGPNDTASNPDTAETATGETELDNFILGQMASGHLPGVAVAVVKDGSVVFSKGYGLRDVEGELPATADTPFMLASVSKTVIAVAALQAADEGLLDLDADIDTVLPFSVRSPKAPTTAITTRMLLTHTAGIADEGDSMVDLYVDGDSDIPLGAFLEDYLTPTGAYYDADSNFTAAAPGAAYEYSNVGAALAAFVVESATTTPFDTWCDTHIFAPLKMDNTAWHLADLVADDVALPYAYEANVYDTYGHYGYPDYPDGALRASANDLARFLLMVIGDGYFDGASVLPAPATAEMLKDTIPELSEGQGLIWYQYVDEDETYWGHEGGDSGTSTTMFFRVSDGVGVIVLANGDAPEGEDDPNALYEIEARLYEAAESW